MGSPRMNDVSLVLWLAEPFDATLVEQTACLASCLLFPPTRLLTPSRSSAIVAIHQLACLLAPEATEPCLPSSCAIVIGVPVM